MLSDEETFRLIRAAKEGDAGAKEALLSANVSLLKSIVRRYLGKGVEFDDLFQLAGMGLLKAIAGFDERFGVRFSTYAVPMIIGEIRRYLRDNSPVRVSRSLRDNAYKALTAREAFTKEHQREPTVEEIAQAIGMKREEVVFALDAISDPISLYEPVYQDGGDAICVMDQVRDPKNTDDSWIEQIAMKQAMSGLSEREKRILALRFYDGRTQIEVAKEIGISQAQVSRLEKGVIEKIKKQL